MLKLLQTPVWSNVVKYQSPETMTPIVPVISFTSIVFGGYGILGVMSDEFSNAIILISSMLLIFGIVVAIGLLLFPYYTKLSQQGLEAISKAHWNEEVRNMLKEKLTRGFLTIHDLNLALEQQAIYQKIYEKNVQEKTLKSIIDKF